MCEADARMVAVGWVVCLRFCVYVHRDGDMVHWYACGDRGALGWGMSDAGVAIIMWREALV